nr:ABC transporter permease [uncultured Mediterraneibacter sp.]
MKNGLYLKLSVNGIKKNKKLYLPYLITCICMVMMFYLIDYLAVSPQFAKIKGGDTMQMILGFGSGVIAIFSLILLYYTNSFLIRRRQREFGLYHILGMGKIDLVKIMVFENLLISVVTIAGGIVGGILFSKLGELLAAKILGSNAGLSMKISVPALVATALLFLAIFALIMLRMIVSVYRLKPVELLRSEKTGEKPPKANWIFAVIGLLLLGVAYYLSLTIKDPLAAMVWFMVAVVLVILATYLLFIAGSVAFCKMMQKKKGYYYKTNHFISISSMIYRMKRNGAGLASICILSTMVLVMVSSTTSLYLSMEHGLNLRYPKSVQIEMYTNPEQTEEMKETQNGQIVDLVQNVLKEHNQTAENPENYRMLTVSGIASKNEIYFNPENAPGVNGVNTFDHLKMIYALPMEEYNRIMGTNLELASGEAYLYTKDSDFAYDQIMVENSGTWSIKGYLDKMISNGNDVSNMNSSLYLVVPGLEDIKALEEGNVSGSYEKWYYNFDLSCGDEEQIKIQNEIEEKINALAEQESDSIFFGVSTDSRAASRADYQALYGGLFFLGILLGVVFILGMVLIIYYKQITEGYEDQDRFQILMKVGMTPKEVRQTINSQVMTVFFLPLVVAGIHTAFAFPMIEKMVQLLAFTDRKFLILVTVCSYLVFALFYIIVYLLTSKQYYKIVSGKQEESLFS